MAMKRFEGKWRTIEVGPNWEDYVNGMGTPAEMRAEHRKSASVGVLQDIFVRGKEVIKIVTYGGNDHVERYMLGEKQEILGVDGRVRTALLYEDGDKVILEESGAFEARTVYQTDGKYFTSTNVANNSTPFIKKWERLV